MWESEGYRPIRRLLNGGPERAVRRRCSRYPSVTIPATNHRLVSPLPSFYLPLLTILVNFMWRACLHCLGQSARFLLPLQRAKSWARFFFNLRLLAWVPGIYCSCVGWWPQFWKCRLWGPHVERFFIFFCSLLSCFWHLWSGLACGITVSFGWRNSFRRTRLICQTLNLQMAKCAGEEKKKRIITGMASAARGEDY